MGINVTPSLDRKKHSVSQLSRYYQSRDLDHRRDFKVSLSHLK